MSYIAKIFEKLELQQIRTFLLQGVECLQVSDESYKERLENAGDSVFKAVEKKISDKEENNRLMSDIHHYASVTQDVYMEIGMQAGTKKSIESA